MTVQKPLRSPVEFVPVETVAAVRRALAYSLTGADGGDEARLFLAAREAARRERLQAAQLVDIIRATWAELADAAGMENEQRSDALAAALTRGLESLVDSRNGARTSHR